MKTNKKITDIRETKAAPMPALLTEDDVKSMTYQELAELTVSTSAKLDSITLKMDEVLVAEGGLEHRKNKAALNKELLERKNASALVMVGNRQKRMSTVTTTKIKVKKMTPEVVKRALKVLEEKGVWIFAATPNVSKFKEVFGERMPAWADVSETESISFVLEED